MRIINLSSGSDGNMTYLESENVKVLIDIGLEIVCFFLISLAFFSEK